LTPEHHFTPEGFSPEGFSPEGFSPEHFTPEEETDALLDALGRGQGAGVGSGDPVVRLLAVLRDDVSRDDGDDGDCRADPVSQRRSSVSMTPST
jgi:hypothetical protein